MVSLGDEVKDTISGFQGIAIARHIFLQGCDRITIQPPVGKDGKLPEERSFDEPQLEIIKAKKIERQAPKKNPGGPEKHVDQGKNCHTR